MKNIKRTVTFTALIFILLCVFIFSLSTNNKNSSASAEQTITNETEFTNHTAHNYAHISYEKDYELSTNKIDIPFTAYSASSIERYTYTQSGFSVLRTTMSDNNTVQLLESEDKLASEYNITATLPTIQNQAAGYILLRNRTNKNIVGALVEFSVYDDYFDIVRMYIVPENTVVTILSDYETLPLETIWNNCSVKYIIDYDEESECHNSRMFFSMGGYKYHLDAQYYGELSIEEVLDLIF